MSAYIVECFYLYRCPDRALDTHIYQAWRDPDSRLGFYADACHQKGNIAAMEREFGPVIVGEWSLATDNCAMWLNGFNDNLPGFPRLPCKFVPCSDPYMGDGVQPGAPVDPTKPIQGPYGSGMSSPIFGWCPVSRDWLKESSGNPQTGRDWVRAPPNAPAYLDDTNNVMTHLAYKKINAFAGIGHGFYFWNFRTDLDEPQWSYMLALDRGWIPRGDLDDDKINNACNAEDNGEFKCILKSNAPEHFIRGAVDYVLNQLGTDATAEQNATLTMTGSDFEDAAETLLSDYFQANKAIGVTCDFGGIAMLIEENRTITDDDYLGWDDDEYQVVVYRGPGVVTIVLLVILGSIVGSVGGFLVAMRVNKKFNRKVRESTMFRRLSMSQNPLVRSSLALPPADMAELNRLIKKDGYNGGLGDIPE